MVDAKKVKEMVAKKSSKFVGNIAGGGKVSPHKHCRIATNPFPSRPSHVFARSRPALSKTRRTRKTRRPFVLPCLFSLAFLSSQPLSPCCCRGWADQSSPNSRTRRRRRKRCALCNTSPVAMSARPRRPIHTADIPEPMMLSTCMVKP